MTFIDKDGFIRACFFDVAYVNDASVVTLNEELCTDLARYNSNVENILSKGYDGASNMRGIVEWITSLVSFVLPICILYTWSHSSITTGI